ncbi:MAG: 3-isopropylmalate dehydrogenase [Candidatus Poribacteria bacterium]|nr:3-isopropylmalate dehydrogenase [Candidatus Poribacteria bacterium]
MDMRIVLIPGDGIGEEVMRSAVQVLDAVQKRRRLNFQYECALLGGCAIDAAGVPLPDETLHQCLDAEIILFGAAGGPKWDHVSPEKRPERALAKLRKEMDLFANLRPVRGRKALAPILPVKNRLIGDGIDLLIVRELTGGLYYGEPRGISTENGETRGYNTMVYTKAEVERVARTAFELAKERSGRLTSIDKANMLETSRLWRETTTQLADEYPDVKLDHLLIDAAALSLISHPSRFDVLVTGNIFGDILSDEAGALAGSLGMLPSASFGSGRGALYEPVHGTAPDIAGQDKANPIAMILSAAMMLRRSFGLRAEARAIEEAVDQALEDGYRTIDIAQKGMKTCGTQEMTDAILQRM